MHEFKDIKKILVIKLRHIGDVLLSVPVFRALRETFSNAYISAIVNSGTEEVLTGNPLIDEVIVFNRNIKEKNAIQKYIEELSFLKAIRGKSFDMTVDLTGGDRAAIISLISGARYRLGWKSNKGFTGKKYVYTHLSEPDSREHMVLQNLHIIRRWGITTDNLKVDFFIPDDARLFVKEVFKKNNISENDRIIHVHPTARWLFKCWKDEYMAEIIEWLLDSRATVIVTSSSDKREMEKAENILSLISSQSRVHSSRLINLCGKTTIKQLGAISAASDLFVGVDSAPMHIATAVGTSVVAIFAMTDEVQWGPWDKGHTVVKEFLECMPCQKGKCDGILPRKCMEAIKPDAVKKAIEDKLNA